MINLLHPSMKIFVQRFNRQYMSSLHKHKISITYVKLLYDVDTYHKKRLFYEKVTKVNILINK